MSNESKPSASLPNQGKEIAVAVSTAMVGTGAAQAAETILEEVTVTATKREASLQDIPMSITAFTDEKIVLEQFKQIDDYAAQIPGLTVNRRQPGGKCLWLVPGYSYHRHQQPCWLAGTGCSCR